MSETGPVAADPRPWYELVQGDELEQGDILVGCPVFRPDWSTDWPDDPRRAQPTFQQLHRDVIVVSQSCDIAPAQKGGALGRPVFLCPLLELSEAARLNPILQSDYGKEECRRGYMARQHMIAGCDLPEHQRDVSVVSFSEIWNLPLGFLQRVALSARDRLRLRSPYREHLSQAFARSFMRVGLPCEIGTFTSRKGEDEIMRRLGSLDEATRDRLLSSFAPPSHGELAKRRKLLWFLSR